MNHKNILLSLALVFLPLQECSAAGLFGIELGSQISSYEYDRNPVDESGPLKVYELKPPKADARFDTYAVDTWNGAVIRIMASSPDDMTAEAKQSLEVCRLLRRELSESFGEPSLRNDDIDDAGGDLRDYLVDEGGIEVMEWDFTGRDGDGIGAVYVFLAGAQDEGGANMSYCTLYLESPEYASLNESVRQSAMGPDDEAPDMPAPPLIDGPSGN